MIYKDLRGFIKQVDELGVLRRVHGADPKFELGGITEVAAGTPECPALPNDEMEKIAELYEENFGVEREEPKFKGTMELPAEAEAAAV